MCSPPSLESVCFCLREGGAYHPLSPFRKEDGLSNRVSQRKEREGYTPDLLLGCAARQNTRTPLFDVWPRQPDIASLLESSDIAWHLGVCPHARRKRTSHPLPRCARCVGHNLSSSFQLQKRTEQTGAVGSLCTLSLRRLSLTGGCSRSVGERLPPGD